MGTMGTELDMENRDPNNLNEELPVTWNDVIGEPDGLHSHDKVWQLSYRCFRWTKGCCYTLLAAVFAPCLAFCFGCHFACLAFQHIWCWSPFLRSFKITTTMLRKFWELFLQAFCAPCCQTCGLLCSQIRIKFQQLPDSAEMKSAALTV